LIDGCRVSSYGRRAVKRKVGQGWGWSALMPRGSGWVTRSTSGYCSVCVLVLQRYVVASVSEVFKSDNNTIRRRQDWTRHRHSSRTRQDNNTRTVARHRRDVVSPLSIIPRSDQLLAGPKSPIINAQVPSSLTATSTTLKVTCQIDR
jgi:hypothetical protein